MMMMMCIKLGVAMGLMLSVVAVEKAESETIGCSIEGLQLDKCFNQAGEYIFLEPCCRALNEAIRVGYHCLCSMFSSTNNNNNAPHHQLTTLFSLSLSSCYIMLPPLSMCPDLRTIPVTLPNPPNSSTKEVRTAQQTPQVPLSPPPTPPGPQAIDVPLDSSIIPSGNSSAVEKQPNPSKNNVTSMLHVVENAINVDSSGSKATHLFCFLCWIFSLTVYTFL